MTLNNHNDIDVVHKYNHVELKDWVIQLQYIDAEIDNLLSLYANTLKDKSVPEKTLKLFSERKKINKELYEKVLPYSNTYSNVVECDDIQCDTAYLEEYDRLREDYKNNLASYQKLKNRLFKEALSKA